MRASLTNLFILLAGSLITVWPGLAAARPPGPHHATSIGAALYDGIGGPVCLAAAAMVAICVGLGIFTGRRSWQLGAGVGGALSIGLALVIARKSGGHDPVTEIALVTGIAGLILPAIIASFRVGSELEN